MDMLLFAGFSVTFCIWQEIAYERKINQTSRSDVTESIRNEFVYKRQILEFVTLSLRRVMVFAFVLVVRRAWRFINLYYYCKVVNGDRVLFWYLLVF